MKLLGQRNAVMQQSDEASLGVFLVEDGARFVESRVGFDESEETICVAQMRDEPSAAWTERVAARFRTLALSGRTARRAVVVVSSGGGGPRLHARAELGRVLLGHLAARNGTQLVLSADGADAALRGELLELVEILLGERAASRVPIRVQFCCQNSEASLGSGVYRVSRSNDTEMQKSGDEDRARAAADREE